jgi:predicted AAA+ superfamily ATPase
MIRRHLEAPLLESLRHRPVVFLQGARQTGKSTLARALAEAPLAARYLTLDDASILAAARSDPAGFIEAATGTLVLDEAQRAPELLLAIKASVDRDRRPGRFLLTGSANPLALPTIADSLAGRMEIRTLSPLSQGEIDGNSEGFLPALFRGDLPPVRWKPETWDQIARRIASGGYPEARTISPGERRRAWFGSYVTAILQRDVRDIAQIEGLTQMPRLLSLLATRIGGLLSFSELSRDSGIPQTTLKRYLALLEVTFLFKPVPAWSGNLGKRLTKSPKVYLNDTGLASYLLGIDTPRFAADREYAGPLAENFVAEEIRKQIEWSMPDLAVFHYREAAGREIDFALEDRQGRLAAIEVKASASLTGRDYEPLRAFAEATGKKFACGVLLYAGREAVPFGKGLTALPLDAVWRLGSKAAK